MKKLLSLFLVFVLVLSVAIVPVFAEGIVFPEENSEWLFLEEFENQYKEAYWYESYLQEYYREECYHYDENNNIDWALVMCALTQSASNDYAVFGDMVNLGSYFVPFATAYVVYDGDQQKFFDLIEFDDFSEYNGLEDYLCSIEFLIPIGDFDKDNKLTILDATGIQRAVAELDTYCDEDDLEANSYMNIRSDNELKYLTDFDRDGERTILDATAIQMKLAQIEE